MTKDRRHIEIKSSPDNIFALIETMPNKFPIYKILETRPLFFLRMLLVDGLRAAISAVRIEKPRNKMILNINDSIGPFTLSHVERPLKYYFTLESFFFNCQTGYSLYNRGETTILSLDIIAENPKATERLWWFLIKPFHILFANKVLRVIKERIENRRKHSES